MQCVFPKKKKGNVMADIIKLAGTFNAVRVRAVVAQNKWDALRERLNKMGVFPSVHDLIKGNVYFQALIPLLCDFVPGRAPQDFTNVACEFGVTILSAKEVRDLTCPPEKEVCIIGGMEGKCPGCNQYRKVIGPAYHLGDPKPVYIMAPHIALAPRSGLCSGTGYDRLEESAT